MALSNAQFDSRLAVTIPAWVSNNLADLITGNNPLWFRLREKGNVRKGGGHGGQFVETLMFPDLTGPQVLSITNAAAAFAALTFADTTNMTGAAYTVAEKLLPIAIQEYDLIAQGSDTEKISLIESVMKMSIAKFNEQLNADIWAAPETVGAQGTRGSLLSLQVLLNGGGALTTDLANPPAIPGQFGSTAVVSTTGANPNFVVGGINRNAAGAAYWCTPTIIAPQLVSITVLSNMISLASRGSDSPDLMIHHRDQYDKIMGLLVNGGTGGGQIYSQSKLADAGFNAVRFRGCDIVFDDRVPKTGFLNNSATALGYNAFAINTDYLHLRAVSMKPDIKEFPDPRALRIWSGYWSGQLTSGNAGRVHCRHANILP